MSNKYPDYSDHGHVSKSRDEKYDHDAYVTVVR